MKTFKHIVDEQLRNITWQGRADEAAGSAFSRAGRTPHAPRRMRLSAVLAVALIAILLAATALAVGLNLSEAYRVGRTARQAVMDRYGLDDHTMDLFSCYPEKKDGVWTVTFGYYLSAAGEYTVTLSAAGPEVSWTYDDVDPSVYADGALDAPVWGPKQLAANMAQREEEFYQAVAEHEETLAQGGYAPRELIVPVYAGGVRVANEHAGAVPDGAALSPMEAIKAANEALDRWQVSEKARMLFEATAAYDDASAQWQVIYSANIEHTAGYWQELYQGALGEYTVTLDDRDGVITTAAWSLQGQDGGNYTRRTWGQSTAYSGPVLDWAADTLRARCDILNKYSDDFFRYAQQEHPVSVEDNAAADQLLRDAGFNALPYYNHVLPEEGDLTLDEAQALFKQAAISELGVSSEVFDRSGYAYTDLTQEDGYRAWYFWLQSNEVPYSWTAVIDAKTGEFLKLFADSYASGNG